MPLCATDGLRVKYVASPEVLIEEFASHTTGEVCVFVSLCGC